MIEAKEFMRLADGTTVTEYFLTNANGFGVKVIDWGAAMTALYVPDGREALRDVVLGYRAPEDYLANGNYFGCVVGRLANRLKGGRLTLDGKPYCFETNDHGNLLHSGASSYSRRLWSSRIVQIPDGQALELTLESPDGDGGFPGKLALRLLYCVTAEDVVELEYSACCEAPTVLNLTNHCYFNLNGAGSGNILSHEFLVNAERRTVVDSELIPTGELREVAGSAYDLRTSRRFGDCLKALPAGFDDNFVLNGEGLRLAAAAYAPESGIEMSCFTTEPGIQFYTGYFLDGLAVGKQDARYRRFDGFCFEAQHFPDSPNHPEFPSVVLRPGETYRQKTQYRFAIR
ncbi:aldose epimerase family protein [Victivallis sp. Marseille-Q1083]|uniref:aldose epimerase family protein n=1 Tax=Victivallis sp. Marseille-Q1083 TaxID=2717288 RepID=UPI00158C251F|nr:aldose epimerase family protein [Victivallis sp. Marseille-Q1083]